MQPGYKYKSARLPPGRWYTLSGLCARAKAIEDGRPAATRIENSLRRLVERGLPPRTLAKRWNMTPLEASARIVRLGLGDVYRTARRARTMMRREATRHHLQAWIDPQPHTRRHPDTTPIQTRVATRELVLLAIAGHLTALGTVGCVPPQMHTKVSFTLNRVPVKIVAPRVGHLFTIQDPTTAHHVVLMPDRRSCLWYPARRMSPPIIVNLKRGVPRGLPRWRRPSARWNLYG